MTTGLPKPDAKNFGDRIREVMLVGMGLVGNRLDTYVTLRMLQDAGLATVSSGYRVSGTGKPITGPGGSVSPPYVVDLTPPPAPAGFSASAGTTNILFQTDPPTYTQGNGHARTRIYAANYSGTGPLPVFSDAVEYTSFVGNIFAAPFDPASNLHLWATWTSKDGVESSPTGGTNGITATTDLVDDAKIANLSAGKILAGSLAVGQYIQSADYVAGSTGWRIATLVGGGAFVEIRGNAVFGGTIYAGAGQIGGSTIGPNYIRSSTYALGTSGWNFNSDGTGQIGGFIVDVDEVRSQNYIAGVQGWRLAYDGSGQLRLATLDAISANLGTVTAGVLRNSTDSVHMDLNATGSTLLFRAGPYTSYGAYAGSHYPVEIYADGSAFFGRGAVSGGALKASGTYSIPDRERPGVIWQTTVTTEIGGP